MSHTIRIPVDVTNPGQFFACCGLLELASRQWRAAVGRFEAADFEISEAGSFSELILAIVNHPPSPTNPEDGGTSPFEFRKWRLRVDWWNDDLAGGGSFKTWAGRQQITAIVRSMHDTFKHNLHSEQSLFNSPAVLYDSIDRAKTVEPLYFDARRAAQAKSIDVGFSSDAHGMMMPVYAAVEYLCLVGLQRFRPARVNDAWTYTAWTSPLPPPVAAAACCRRDAASRTFAFSLLYRTKYLKGFLPASPFGDHT